MSTFLPVTAYYRKHTPIILGTAHRLEFSEHNVSETGFVPVTMCKGGGEGVLT
jgi:hypothetical protein